MAGGATTHAHMHMGATAHGHSRWRQAGYLNLPVTLSPRCLLYSVPCAKS
ncbi:hypothetical protein AB205_0147580 [Aquarana catesbeiana]|uniref:Uncharacterized protein n=1 Tax=Aquarana catesbeiana TaxID=8400 RepID=A0A2G9NT78_AQUCT|nr:hypothetical protein AB205_0147580 [Aquarana catesbeiana]